MNPRETAIKLVVQATDPAASSEEARTFALKAAQIIRQHGLLEPQPHRAGVGQAPMPEGLGMFGAVLQGIAASGIMKDIDTAAHGAAAAELITLRAKVETLTRQNAHLKLKLEEATRPPVRRRRR